MKLKYYLRGLGIGIIITTIILMISFSLQKGTVSDEEIIRRAEQLGMVMKEDDTGNSEIITTEEQPQDEQNSEETETNSEGTEALDEENRNNSEEMTGTDHPEANNVSSENDLENSENPVEEPVDTPDANPDVEAEPYSLTVYSGEVCRNVCEDLYENGLIDDSEAFRKYLGNVGFASSIGAGNYQIPFNLSYEEIYNILRAGPIEED